MTHMAEPRSWRAAIFVRGGPKFEEGEGVYLGFTRAQWPIHCFKDVEQAARWAADDEYNRLVIGPVAIPESTPVLKGATIPIQYVLEEA